MSERPTVLVVGARTTGLMMGAELARRGLAVRVIDQSPGIDPHVRANLLHSRTLEIFQGLGLAEAATEASVAERGIRLYANNGFVANLDHAPIDSPFPYGVSQSQAHVEAVLEAHLNRHGVTVERRVSLEALEINEACVLATLVHGDGRQEQLEVPWLVGCDGAHSATRHKTVGTFPGERDPYRFLLADVSVSGDFEEGYGYFFLHDEGDLYVFSTLPEGRRLVCANVDPADDPPEPPGLERIQSIVDERGLPGTKLSDPRWLAHFGIQYRLAPHYRQGRAFLAGDAAHIHSLLGGQGMNTGIQDAFNLAWKLALVIEGVVPEWWLDTYESERRGIAQGVLADTRAMTEEAERFAGLSGDERERLIERLLVPVAERPAAARHLQEVDLDYRASRLCVEPSDPALRLSTGPHAGAQVPDAAPIEVAGETMNLYRFLGGTAPLLFLFAGRDAGVDEEALGAAYRRAVERCGDFVDVYAVTVAPLAPPDMAVIRDPEGALHAGFGAAKPCLYFIRPDGYVGYRSADWMGIGAYLDVVLAE